MSMSIDDIWNTPLDGTPPRTRKDVLANEANGNTPSRPSPAKRRRTTLFLSSDSENDEPSTSNAARRRETTTQPTVGDKQKALIDALFDDLDDEGDDGGGFKELAPAESIDEVRKQAQASQRNRTRIPTSTPYEVLPSSSPERDLGPGDVSREKGGKGRKGEGEDGPKKRKPIPKLDETRLIGDNGFPALIKQTKNFKPKGKGHELSDLNRVMGIYQFWTHKLYPKGTFRDNVQRIERLCHSKRMHNHLGMWRDASKGLVNGRKPEDLVPIGDPEDSDSDSDSNMEQEPSNVPTTAVETAHTRSSSPPTRPPSSASSGAPPDDDFDIDEMIREDEERQMAAARNTQSTVNAALAPLRRPVEPDEDQDMWDALDEGGLDEDSASKPRQPAPPQQQQTANDVEDEDMWDLVREIEENGPSGSMAATASISVNPGPGETTTTATRQSGDPKSSATNDEGWDEMYL